MGYRDFASNANSNLSDFLGSDSYATSPGTIHRGLPPVSISPYGGYSPLPPVDLPVSGNMNALLETLRGGGVPFSASSNRYADDGYQSNLLLQQQQQLLLQQQLAAAGGGRNSHVLGDVNLNLGYSNSSSASTAHQLQLSAAQAQIAGVAQARNGYTPTEEYILQAHATAAGGTSNNGAQTTGQRRRPNRLDIAQAQTRMEASGGAGDPQVDFNMGMRGYRTQASTLAFNQNQNQAHEQQYASPMVGHSALSPSSMNESEFHSSVAATGQGRGVQPGGAGNRLAGTIRAAREREAAADQIQQQASYSNQSPQFQSHFPTRHSQQQQQNQQSHVRSSTLPPTSSPFSSNNNNSTSSATQQQQPQHSQHSRHYQHNSMSIPKSRNIAADIMRSIHQQPQHHNVNHDHSKHSKHRSTSSISKSNNNTNEAHSNSNSFANNANTNMNISSNNGSSAASLHPRGQHRHNTNTNNHNNNSKTDPSHGQLYPSNAHQNMAVYPDPEVYEVSQSSPPLVSPALTYSSRGSAATLSPSTPYMGSFPPGSGDTNEHPQRGPEGVQT